MKEGTMLYKLFPATMVLAIAGMVFGIAIACHYTVAGTFQTTYQFVKITKGNERFEVGCSKWYSPSFAYRKTFSIYTNPSTRKTNEMEQLRAAETYFTLLVSSECELERATIIKQVP